MSAAGGARPLDLLGSSALSRLRGAAAEALEEWRLAWGIERLAPRIECTRAWELAKGAPLFDEGWEGWEGSGAEAPWLAASPALVPSVEQMLFGGSGALAAEVARRAADDLAGRLLRRFGASAPRRASTTPAPPASILRFGSGTALLELQLAEARLGILVQGPRLAAAPRVSTALGEVHSAMQGVPVTLGAELAELDLELGMLQSLEAGDVIRLPLPIDQPLRVTSPDGRTVCYGDLGQVAGFRALALRKTASAAGPE